MGRAVLLLSHQHPEEEEEGQGTVTSHHFSSASVKKTSHNFVRRYIKITSMDNSGKEKEAVQLMAEADKKVKSSGSFLGGMFG